jgi:hypothetical protein
VQLLLRRQIHTSNNFLSKEPRAIPAIKTPCLLKVDTSYKVVVTVALRTSMQEVSRPGYLLLSVIYITKVEAAGSPETLLLAFQITCRHHAESRYINLRQGRNQKSCICYPH